MNERIYEHKGKQYRVADFDGEKCVFYRYGEAWVLMGKATQHDLEQIGYVEKQEEAA